MERLYLDTNGDTRPHKDVTRHHAFSRCVLRGAKEKRWGNQAGLVLPMFREWHNEGNFSLHRQLPHPPRPIHELRCLISQELRESDDENVYDMFTNMVHMIGRVAHTTGSDALAENAGKVHKNLQLQSRFILNGLVRPLDEAV